MMIKKIVKLITPVFIVVEYMHALEQYTDKKRITDGYNSFIYVCVIKSNTFKKYQNSIGDRR